MASNELDAKKTNIITFPYYVDDASGQSQSATAMSATGEATVTDCAQQPCPWAGSIVGISVQGSDDATAGVLTVRPTINGSSAAAAETLSLAGDIRFASSSWNRGAYPVTAGQRIGCDWSTDAAWVMTGPSESIRVLILVHVETV